MNEYIILENLNIAPLLQAAATFSEALDEVDSTLTRDGAIQRFEYTFELSWKTLKKVLKYRGLETNSPREVIRVSAAEGLIDEPTAWLTFLDHRNNTCHTYNSDLADKIYSDMPYFKAELDKLLSVLKAL